MRLVRLFSACRDKAPSAADAALLLRPGGRATVPHSGCWHDSQVDRRSFYEMRVLWQTDMLDRCKTSNAKSYAVQTANVTGCPIWYSEARAGSRGGCRNRAYCSGGVCRPGPAQVAATKTNGNIQHNLPMRRPVMRLFRPSDEGWRECHQVKPGDHVAVGVMVDSCRNCPNCSGRTESNIASQFRSTPTTVRTSIWVVQRFGGYSSSIVVDEAFVFHGSRDLILPRRAPLLCAGITTYSPLRHWKVGQNQKVESSDLGGLGSHGV